MVCGFGFGSQTRHDQVKDFAEGMCGEVWGKSERVLVLIFS